MTQTEKERPGQGAPSQYSLSSTIAAASPREEAIAEYDRWRGNVLASAEGPGATITLSPRIRQMLAQRMPRWIVETRGREEVRARAAAQKAQRSGRAPYVPKFGHGATRKAVEVAPFDVATLTDKEREVYDSARRNGMAHVAEDRVMDLRRKEAEDAEAPGAGSWEPRDISAVLNGTFTTPSPDLGVREDGEFMLYSGKEHSIASEPECGKTWWVLMQVRAVLAGGGNVVYIDFEDDEGTIVGRLHHTLGVPADQLGPDRWRYVRPEKAPTVDEYAKLMDFSPALVVLDGVTESMSILGLEVNSNDHSAVWRRTFVRPALAAGAATLATDHVVKDRDSRGRFALGGGHKLAGLTGAMFKLEQVHPFGKGLKGTSRVLCTKDRNGGLRVKGEPTKEPGITYMGDLVGDSVEGSSWKFYPPRPEGDDEDFVVFEGLMPPHKLRDPVVKVKAWLARNPGSSTREVRANTGLGNEKVQDALTWLVTSGQVEQTSGPRGAKLYAVTLTGSEVSQ